MLPWEFPICKVQDGWVVVMEKAHVISQSVNISKLASENAQGRQLLPVPCQGHRKESYLWWGLPQTCCQPGWGMLQCLSNHKAGGTWAYYTEDFIGSQTCWQQVHDLSSGLSSQHHSGGAEWGIWPACYLDHNRISVQGAGPGITMWKWMMQRWISMQKPQMMMKSQTIWGHCGSWARAVQ